MPLSTPCNGFLLSLLTLILLPKLPNFQLHVMDSALLKCIFVVLERVLSTPCNGFMVYQYSCLQTQHQKLSTPCNGFPTVDHGSAKLTSRIYFQLHVMDSSLNKARAGEAVNFQLHIMDSGFALPQTAVVHRRRELSTPYNGFGAGSSGAPKPKQ